MIKPLYKKVEFDELWNWVKTYMMPLTTPAEADRLLTGMKNRGEHRLRI